MQANLEFVAIPVGPDDLLLTHLGPYGLRYVVKTHLPGSSSYAVKGAACEKRIVHQIRTAERKQPRLREFSPRHGRIV